MYIRNEIEKVIKEKNLDRSRCFEFSKLKYSTVIKKIEDTFVLHGGNIHWSNMGHGFNPKFPCICKNIEKDILWFTKLPYILPSHVQSVFVLFEDSKNCEVKYYLYEMHIPELICVLLEVNGLNDFYIVSKKFDFLISECHEDIVSFVGNNLNLSCFNNL